MSSKPQGSNQTTKLKVKFHEIPAGGLDYGFSSQTGELNLVLFDLMGDYPTYKTSLHLKNIDSMAQLSGEVSGQLHLVCSRCAEDFTNSFNKKFVTGYYRSEDTIKSLPTSFDDLTGSFDLELASSGEVDLGEVVHEQIALEIPFQPLCTQECKGLCTVCGSNLNLEVCSCQNSEGQLNRRSPFEKLKVLKGDT